VVLSITPYSWMVLLGIVIFSIGEMTTHPKYYSYIGLVAPEDKKAVYMGYAFLYGVIGSLFGSNIGGEMYHKILTPLIGETIVGTTLRNFWLIFAMIGVFTAVAMFVYNKLFADDTPATRAGARRVMYFIYSVLVLGAAGILYMVYSPVDGIPVKTWIQAGIMIIVGAGGLLIMRRNKG
jgi:hypothetical protein